MFPSPLHLTAFVTDLPFLFCCQSPLLPTFFSPQKILFSSSSTAETPSPNNSHKLFFDASFMVLFPNALYLPLFPSFTATPSNLHHRLLCGVAASPLLVSSWLLLLPPTSCPFLILSSSLSLHPCSFSPFFYAPTLLFPSHSLFHHYHFSPPFSAFNTHPHATVPFFSHSLSFSVCGSLR